MITTIVVATDASDHARKAVALASDMAATYGARLVIVHALLRDAPGEKLRKLADRKALTKEQRKLLSSYEIDAQMAVARAGGLEFGMVTVPAPLEVLEPIGQQILNRAADVAYKAGVKTVATAVIGGDPADGILAAARREKADLVVLGTRGYGEVKGLLLGSVSHKVAAQAHCPVLTVK